VAGFGALVRDPDTGAVLVERAEPLGLASNNVAEYSGLLAGLEAAQGLDPGAHVEVRLDSKLVVEQMAGRWKVRHEDMRRLSLQAQQICRAIRAAGGSVTFTWVPREQNKAADALSNLAMDGRSVDRTLTHSATSGPADPAEPDAPAAPLDVTSRRSEGSSRLGEPTRVLLVRHAVTDYTETARVDGRGGANPPLNIRGRQMASAVAGAVERLVDGPSLRLVTSSLVRTVQTGAAIAQRLGLEPSVDPDWDEQAFGEWDGLTFAEIAVRYPAKLARLRLEAAYAPPGGESRAALRARVLTAFDRATAPQGTVIIVTSRVPLLVVLADLLGIGVERFFSIATEPASVTEVRLWPDGGVVVGFVNRTDHVDGI
jgi:probable phosphoglycerate mutase